MTRQLEQLFQELGEQPEERQRQFAALIRYELDEDQLWADTTKRHTDKLTRLVDQVLADDAAGLCETLDPDKL